MTSDGILVVLTLFRFIWRLFTCFYIPGTHTTPAEWFMFLGAAGIALRFVQRVTMSYYASHDEPISQEGKITYNVR